MTVWEAQPEIQGVLMDSLEESATVKLSLLTMIVFVLTPHVVLVIFSSLRL